MKVDSLVLMLGMMALSFFTILVMANTQGLISQLALGGFVVLNIGILYINRRPK